MKSDEQQIHELVQTWLEATKRGDTATVLGLMADDVVFMVPGQTPFGKEAFAAASKGMKDFRCEGESEILELHVMGEWAWMRQRLRVTLTLPNGRQNILSGHTLGIFRKNSDGRWVIWRDANLVMPEPAAARQ